MLDQIHQQFIAVVKAGRGERLKRYARDVQRLVLEEIGQQAIELGLADHLGNLDYVAREVVKVDEIIIHPPRQRRRTSGQGLVRPWVKVP